MNKSGLGHAGYDPDTTVRALKAFGVITSAAIAVAGTFVLLDYLLHSASRDWWGYPAVGFVMVGGAWIACAAWATNRRLLAVPGHLVTLLAPWGFVYFIPLLAVVLALAAGATFRSSQGPSPILKTRSSEVPSAWCRSPEGSTEGGATKRKYNETHTRRTWNATSHPA